MEDEGGSNSCIYPVIRPNVLLRKGVGVFGGNSKSYLENCIVRTHMSLTFKMKRLTGTFIPDSAQPKYDLIFYWSYNFRPCLRIGRQDINGRVGVHPSLSVVLERKTEKNVFIRRRIIGQKIEHTYCICFCCLLLSSSMGSTVKLFDLAGDGGSWFAEINEQWLVALS